MSELVKQLAQKEPHYIRCIKPNEEKNSNVFDLERVEHQVREIGWGTSNRTVFDSDFQKKHI